MDDCCSHVFILTEAVSSCMRRLARHWPCRAKGPQEWEAAGTGLPPDTLRGFSSLFVIKVLPSEQHDLLGGQKHRRCWTARVVQVCCSFLSDFGSITSSCSLTTWLYSTTELRSSRAVEARLPVLSSIASLDPLFDRRMTCFVFIDLDGLKKGTPRQCSFLLCSPPVRCW